MTLRMRLKASPASPALVPHHIAQARATAGPASPAVRSHHIAQAIVLAPDRPGGQVVEGLEETRTQLVMVTEAVFCSVGNLLTGFQGLPDKVLPSLGSCRDGWWGTPHCWDVQWSRE